MADFELGPERHLGDLSAGLSPEPAAAPRTRANRRSRPIGSEPMRANSFRRGTLAGRRYLVGHS